mgnify:CR=1 FL=1
MSLPLDFNDLIFRYGGDIVFYCSLQFRMADDEIYHRSFAFENHDLLTATELRR